MKNQDFNGKIDTLVQRTHDRLIQALPSVFLPLGFGSKVVIDPQEYAELLRFVVLEAFSEFIVECRPTMPQQIASLEQRTAATSARVTQKHFGTPLRPLRLAGWLRWHSASFSIEPSSLYWIGAADLLLIGHCISDLKAVIEDLQNLLIKLSIQVRAEMDYGSGGLPRYLYPGVQDKVIDVSSDNLPF